MKWQNLNAEPCSVARTLSVIGERWTILILREAFRNVTRFEDFEAALGLPRALLAQRLKELVEKEVFEKKQDPAHARRFDYILSSKGKELRPVLLTMLAWGDKHMTDKPAIIVSHTRCGHDITPELHCPKCNKKLENSEVKTRINRL
jgi:DNA-binding HxlR family transcriptional regulator